MSSLRGSQRATWTHTSARARFYNQTHTHTINGNFLAYVLSRVQAQQDICECTTNKMTFCLSGQTLGDSAKPQDDPNVI